ncbi:glycosyltransferase [Ancylobacter lacus]|nr:glycosyltransferase [Ancylobacter lacus]
MPHLNAFPDPSVSIVIVSDGRRDALVKTLESLNWLEAASFEVVVVCGPTPDGTREAMAALRERIKVRHCAVRNISVARNIGIAAASGEIIVFLDDDAFPEPEWLGQLVAPYADPQVGAVGGIVYDHTGVGIQYDFAVSDRLGHTDRNWHRAADEFNFPYSSQFPHILGANSSARRAALLDIGGFDEEYEFYLDETDLCCRLIDAGWTIRQLDHAFVHHKFLPSAIRSENKITRKRYAILKNKIYFSIINNRGHHSRVEIVEDALAFIREHTRDMVYNVDHGKLLPADLAEFHADADLALEAGMARGLSGARRLPPPGFLSQPAPFLPFPRSIPRPGAGAYCFVSREYPPGVVGGIGSHIFALATTVAAMGHQVHVITESENHHRVDFEHGVWVHRLDRNLPRVHPPAGVEVPRSAWRHATRVLEEIRRIAAKRPVRVVHSPIWDAEGIAVTQSGEFAHVVGLHTTMRQWLDSHPDKAADTEFMERFGTPMLAAEARLLREADAIHGNSAAIVEEIRARHGVDLAPPRLTIVPHGLIDETGLPAVPPAPLPPGAVRVLFVGRLELRKGVQFLLPALARLMAGRPGLHVDMVGDDSIADAPGGLTFRQAFEAGNAPEDVKARLRFHGRTPEADLRGFYAEADLVVVPSLFESFGLVLVEAMMRGKATIASRAGGMVEIGIEGETTLFAEPGDEASLEAALARLIDDAELRARLGAGGRRRYEARFTAERMAQDVLRLLDEAAGRFAARNRKIAS